MSSWLPDYQSGQLPTTQLIRIHIRIFQLSDKTGIQLTERKVGHWCWHSNFSASKSSNKISWKETSVHQDKLLMEVYIRWEGGDIINTLPVLYALYNSWKSCMREFEKDECLRRPFIHIECFIKKEVITVYFIHNYLWGYKPINREHFVFFWQACPLHNAKKKQEKEGGWEGDKNKTKDGLFSKTKK